MKYPSRNGRRDRSFTGKPDSETRLTNPRIRTIAASPRRRNGASPTSAFVAKHSPGTSGGHDPLVVEAIVGDDEAASQ